MPADHAASRVALLLAARGVAAVTICDHMPSLCDGTYSALHLVSTLNGEGLNGTLPVELFTQNDQLESLDASINLVSGTIPTEIGLLSKLSSLSFSENMLTGPLPTEIGLLTKLTTLLLDRNSLAGPLPTEIGKLSSLATLQLNANLFTGAIPNELALANLPCLHTCRFTISQCLAAYSAFTNPDSYCGGSNNSNAFSCPVPPMLDRCQSNLGIDCVPSPPPSSPSPYCDPTNPSGMQVHGIAHRLTRDDLERLDEFEGSGFKRIEALFEPQTRTSKVPTTVHWATISARLLRASTACCVGATGTARTAVRRFPSSRTLHCPSSWRAQLCRRAATATCSSAWLPRTA